MVLPNTGSHSNQICVHIFEYRRKFCIRFYAGQGTEEKAVAVRTEEEEGEWLSIRQREELALQVTHWGLIKQELCFLGQVFHDQIDIYL